MKPRMKTGLSLPVIGYLLNAQSRTLTGEEMRKRGGNWGCNTKKKRRLYIEYTHF